MNINADKKTDLRFFGSLTMLVLAGNLYAQEIQVPTVTVARGNTANVVLDYVAGGGTTNFDFAITYDETLVDENAITFACDPDILGLTGLICEVDLVNNQVKGTGDNATALELVSGAFAVIDLPVLATATTGDSVSPFSGNFLVDTTPTPFDTTWTLDIVSNELKNISTRADVGTGDDIAIAGFIISGVGQKCVIIRGRGPSVNVPDVVRLPDPVLTLKSGSTTIAENDNWTDQSNPDHEAIIRDSGYAPGDLLDAAIYACLDPGAYTALLTGFLNTTGIGIVEVLDVDDAPSYLANISTRARVGTGDLVAIAGIIIEGDTPKKVLLRGRGPSVAVPDAVPRLADPLLRLMSGNTVIGENDDWGDAANVDDIIATGQAPANPLDSAILMELQPGVYTTILRGAGGGEGSGIIEVIDRTGLPDIPPPPPPPLEGEVETWFEFWHTDFPGPSFDTESMVMERDEYGAIEFNTGSHVFHVGVISLANTSSNGTRLGAISESPGDFDVADECTHSWGSSGGIGWATDGTPGYCQLEANTTYYLNITFTDGVDPDSSQCQPDEICRATLQYFNLD